MKTKILFTVITILLLSVTSSYAQFSGGGSPVANHWEYSSDSIYFLSASDDGTVPIPDYVPGKATATGELSGELAVGYENSDLTASTSLTGTTFEISISEQTISYEGETEVFYGNSTIDYTYIEWSYITYDTVIGYMKYSWSFDWTNSNSSE